jgi:hypothetical protein
MMRVPRVNARHQDLVVLDTTEGVAGAARRLARGRVRALPPFARRSSALLRLAVLPRVVSTR